MLSRATVSTTSSPVVLELGDVPRSDPWDTVRRASRIVSSRVGIIRRLGHARVHAQDPKAFALGIIGSDLSRYCATENTSKSGGAGDALVHALAATLGEAVERYCMFFYDKRQMILAAYKEVAADAVHPDLLRLYSRRQIDRVSASSRAKYFTEDSRIRWVWAYSLTHQRPRLVPASLVYMNYKCGDDEAAIGSNASTGLAAGVTIEEAILVGLNEVVERDAFTMCWLRRRPGRRIVIDDDQMAEYMAQRYHARHPRVSIAAYDVTLDVGLPSIFLVLKRPAEFGPTVCVGSATRLNAVDALRKCCVEAGQSLSYFRFLLGQLKNWQPAPDYSDVTSFDHHAIFYTKRPDLVPPAFEFLDNVEETVLLSALPNYATGRVLSDLTRSIGMLRDAGLEVIAAEITTPDIREIGMRVVRVMVPGMLPLHGVHRFPFLGAKRLAQYPAEGAWSGGDPDATSPFPHPFP